MNVVKMQKLFSFVLYTKFNLQKSFTNFLYYLTNFSRCFIRNCKIFAFIINIFYLLVTKNLTNVTYIKIYGSKSYLQYISYK